MSSAATLPSDAASVPPIRVRSVSHLQGNVRVLRGISFDVGVGEIYGMVGAVGAGKTTLARLLAAVQEPSVGSIEICGFDTSLHPLKARRCLGYLPHPPVSYPQLTVREYLEFFRRVGGIEDASRVRAVLERTRLDHRSGQLIAHLNEGQRQRLGLARALLHDPAVLILDEPMSQVDPMRRDALSSLLLDLKSSGKSLLLFSPISSDVAGLCDRVGILHAGRLLAQGSIEEIIDQSGAKSIRSGLVALQDRLSVEVHQDDRRSYLDTPAGRPSRPSDAPARVQRLRVRVLGEPSSVPPLLRELPEVVKIEPAPDGSLMISHNSDETFAADLIRHLVGHDVDLLSVEPQHGELERIFRSLTGGGG